MHFRFFPPLAAATVLLLSSLIPRSPADARAALSVPSGFHTSVYAQGLSSPTAIAVGPDKRLYVAQQNGVIVAVGNGGQQIVASGFGILLGLAWHGRRLYASSTGEISVITPSRGYQSFSSRVIVSGLPTGKHQNDGIAFRGSWMYVGVGSTCNACAEQDRRSASIMRFHLDGSHAQIFAHGLRNPYGLAFRPATGQLYATDNGRDDFGNSVPDELNLIKRGHYYGWPNCWGNGGGSGCRGTTGPVALFEPHSSADGLLFYTGHTYPKRYQGDAFVAEWGDSVNNLGTGQRVKDVHFVGNRATVSDFFTGLVHPLSLALAPDSSLLIADFGSGIVWRVQANRH